MLFTGIHECSEVVGWSYARVVPGADATSWLSIAHPHRAARILADAGEDLVEGRGVAAIDLDAFDHLYRVTFDAHELAAGTSATLTVPSVATIATITWNDSVLATSDNAFVPVELDLTDLLAAGGTLEIRCHSITAWLDATRWPRPRFKTKLVADQRLRHVRAPLVGRVPSWSPPVPAVGVSGPVILTTSTGPILRDVVVTPTLTGGHGRVTFSAVVNSGSDAVRAATITCATASGDLRIEEEKDGDVAISGDLSVADVQAWWPHTHGEPARYPVHLRLALDSGALLDTQVATTGFRALERDHGADGLGLTVKVNDIPIFCRGSAWMPIDPRDAWVLPDSLRTTLTQCRDAGLNMIRVTGVTGWEQPAFYDLCDELGILVWQDLPFATLDQPTDDAFISTLTNEVETHLGALSSAPSVVVICGGSERQQQAAMLGLDQATVVDAVGVRVMRDVADRLGIGAILVDCSPSEGHLPFSVDAGASHYYGVGAYLRPLTDARHANVRFTSECLAFANVPEPRTLDRFLADGETPTTHPRWKQRVPRDRGVGWDFDDVRDHYVRLITGEDPTMLRWRDVDRYLELSRFAPGVVMASTMHEWRRPTSSCGGAITWFLRDIWRGAGWGLIDSDGEAKAVLHALAESWDPISIGLIDEGLNGVDVWIHNDTAEPFTGIATLSRTLDAHTLGTSAAVDVSVPARGSVRLRADELTGRFSDPSDSFLFGPSAHDAITVLLTDAGGASVSRSVVDTSGGRSFQRTTIAYSATTEWADENTVLVHVSADDLVRGIRLESPTLVADRHHVDVTPGETRTLRIRRVDDRAWPSTLALAAVNGRNGLRLTLPSRSTPEP